MPLKPSATARRIMDSCGSGSKKSIDVLNSNINHLKQTDLYFILKRICVSQKPNGYQLATVIINAGASADDICFISAYSQEMAELMLINGAIKNYDETLTIINRSETKVKEHHVKAILKLRTDIPMRFLERLLSIALSSGLSETVMTLLDIYHIPVTESCLCNVFDNKYVQGFIFTDDVCLSIMKRVDKNILNTFSQLFGHLAKNNFSKSLEWLLIQGIRPNSDIQWAVEILPDEYECDEFSYRTYEVLLRYKLLPDLMYAFKSCAKTLYYDTGDDPDGWVKKFIYLLFDYGLDRQVLINELNITLDRIDRRLLRYKLNNKTHYDDEDDDYLDEYEEDDYLDDEDSDAFISGGFWDGLRVIDKIEIESYIPYLLLRYQRIKFLRYKYAQIFFRRNRWFMGWFKIKHFIPFIIRQGDLSNPKGCTQHT